ncbi:hypothetical protein W04_1677 [Pseudoalteromonas sp. SW0106-04]|uniref:hypothetical protein n=1 Tax=Pseudoalteromonas sp. SW0106-04 TaxID=1702169 RepID=UPI0006B52953|nr:hypothetical protein [Pseudoalteromonas sp. SW0106-04]GAP75158.1 hypothetical protein W04_1677 [Pseudoalteromonas sp. SW0106-04]
MGNLFLREKERWGLWTFWGVVGALLTTYVAMLTKAPLYITLSAMAVVVFIAIWMLYTRRFGFLRALKVSAYILCFSALPALCLLIVPASKNQRPELITQSVIFALLALIGCVVCALIAKRPRQYY